MLAVTTATTRICASCEAASTKTTLGRSALFSGAQSGASGMVANGVSASLSVSLGRTVVDCSIGLTRSRVAEMTKAAAMETRNAIARPSRSPLIVAAISQT